MNRREALQMTATVLGGSIIGSEIFLSGCTANKDSYEFFSNDDLMLMDEIGETILPTSDRSPGAKAAHIGQFMKTMVTDCYEEKEAKSFMTGLRTIETTSKEKYGKSFLVITGEERQNLLAEFDKKARRDSNHFFGMMKQLTIWGYFSSEPGATQSLRYNPVPGRFEGCIPYQVGDKAWAS